MASLKNLSETAASNTSIDGVNVAEGTAMSNLNNGIRSVAAILRQAAAGATATVASQSVTDIITPDSNFIAISGNSAIDAFAAGSPGLIKYLQFQSVLMLNASASLLTPGNANISIFANDIGQIRYESSTITRLIALTKSAGLGVLTGLITGSGLTSGPSALLGRISAGTGAVEQISILGSLSLTASGLQANIASQADQEAMSSINALVSSARQHFHPGSAKAWGFVTLSAGTPSVTAGYNLAGTVTDNGTGDTTVDLSITMSSTNFCAIATPFESTAVRIVTVKAKTTTSVTIVTTNDAGAAADSSFFFAIFGDI